MDQLTKLLSGLSNTQRITIVLVALMTGGGIFGFTQWKRESDFRPLYTGMAPEDAAGVVQKLRESGVEYRLAEGGGSVLVPSAKLAESRLTLAAAGLPKTGRIGFELFDKSNFGATDFVEHINYKRALEGELERSVTSLAEVEQARVHLTLPKESVFLEKQQPAKASVMVKLRPGAVMSPQNVLAVTNLVANAVEGLGPESVSIVDMSGNLLNRPRRSGDPDGAEATSEAIEIRHQLERDLVAKIHSTLEPLIGPDRFRAGASVEYDLTSAEQQEETFDPTKSVMVNSQKTEDLTEKASAAGGIPGTASNLPGSSAAGRPGTGGGVSRRTENVAFQSSRIIKHTRIPQGLVKRMSLSILVDNTVKWEGEGAARHRVLEPPPPETLKTIKDLVAAATGFNADRGDQLIVESLPFEVSLNAEPTAGGASQQSAKPGSKQAPIETPLQQLLKNKPVLIGVSVGAVVLLLILIVGIRKLTQRKPEREVELPEMLERGAAATEERMAPMLRDEIPLPPQLSPSEEPVLLGKPDATTDMGLRVRLHAQKDPTVAANIVRVWLHESESQSK